MKSRGRGAGVDAHEGRYFVWWDDSGGKGSDGGGGGRGYVCFIKMFFFSHGSGSGIFRGEH